MTASAFNAPAFAARLRLAILSRGIQQQQAAWEAGINQATMSRAVHGGMISVPSLYKLCAWLGVSADDFATNGRKTT